MTQTDALATLRTILGWIALALAITAALKMFGFHIPVPGSITENALVALAIRGV